MIPKVKEWIIRVEADDGLHSYRVLAPTRLLAVLNLRHEACLAHRGKWSIVSASVSRNPVGTHEMVAYEGRS